MGETRWDSGTWHMSIRSLDFKQTALLSDIFTFKNGIQKSCHSSLHFSCSICRGEGDGIRLEGGVHLEAGHLRQGGEERRHALHALRGHPRVWSQVRLELRPKRAFQVPDRSWSGDQGLGGGCAGHVYWREEEAHRAPRARVWCPGCWRYYSWRSNSFLRRGACWRR